MRIFVALDTPEDVRRALGELVDRLAKTSRRARWVRPEGMHLTLKFIGETAPDVVEQIKLQLRKIHSSQPVEMRFHGTGFFPSEKRPRVLWAGIEASANVVELASAIDRGLETLGIPREPRPFVPHLTLARFRSSEGLGRLREEIDRLGPAEFGSARAAEFRLFQSVLKPGGAEYIKLASFQFCREAN